LNVLELGEDRQGILDYLPLGLFRSIQGMVRNQNVAIEIDSLHFFLARKCTTFRSNVFTALNETVSPDFVLNLTVAGLRTVLVATNLTFLCAMKL